MRELSTIQKREKLNTVFAADEAGVGNASHEYAIYPAGSSREGGEFSCRENACALTHIEEALMWMNRRVEDRIERQVLGTEKK